MTTPKVTVETSTMAVEKALMNQVRDMLAAVASGNIPFTTEVNQLKKSVDEVLEKANARHLMQGRYRCTHCFHQWTVEDELNDAKDCPKCNTQGLEPYFSGNPYDFDAVPTYALAEHERRYPDPAAYGTYNVEVQRTAFRCKQIQVENEIGPASAEIHAMALAPDQIFSSDIDAEYHVEGYEFEPADLPDTQTDNAG